MARWFLSYHSPDQALAERLKVAIERRDSGSRVFFAPTHLRAGGSWTAQLAQELDGATAFILLVGGAGIGKWQVPEYDEALDKWVKSDKKFPLVVVLLEGQTAPGLPFLRQLHWIVTPEPSSEKDIARIFDALSGSGSSPGELWRYTSPYRGLEAMKEEDSDYFFGRKRATVEILSALAAGADRLPVLIGNSGVGKSSLAQAGVLAALKRQAWPDDAQAPNAWPAPLQSSRQWCFLSLKPGTEPLRALVDSFLDTWQYVATDPERVTRQHGWVKALRGGKATLPDLIDATERRRKELDQPKPPGFFLYVDQGEELYARAEESQRHRFSGLLVQALSDPRLHVMMSMRSDFLGHLQADKPLFKARQHVDVPPLGEEELCEIVGCPAQLLSARFESDGLIEIISRRTAEDSVKDVGALPLLSYTLDDMWASMVRRGDGTLRLPAQSFELGGVLVDRANRFLETHSGDEDALRRVLTLRLATVREDGEPTRRRAAHGEFTGREWRLISELADYPNRLLVTVTTEAGDTFAEVAHEAIFRRWDRLRTWIAAEREFLIWRGGLERDLQRWKTAPPESKEEDALLMGLGLWQAQDWLEKRADDLTPELRDFVVRSGKVEAQRREAARQAEIRRAKAEEELARLRAEQEAREQRERADVEGRARREAEFAAKKARIRAQRLRVAVVTLTAVVIGIAIAWQRFAIKENYYWFTQVNGHVLTAAQESALKPGDTFRECAKNCPQMVVVPAGTFMMGSPTSEPGRYVNEGPQHQVTIGKPFAVSRYEVTFEEWGACVAVGACPDVSDAGFGRGKQPVISVSYDDAQRYVAWLSRMTKRTYRLLSDAEWEYAAKASTTTAYYWGDQIGTNNADCRGCGSKWDGQEPAPIGQFKPNAFGLYDMAGNVWQWTADCWHDNYVGAPADGSAWLAGGNCNSHMVRGGAWDYAPNRLRSADHDGYASGTKIFYLGLRVARTLVP